MQVEVERDDWSIQIRTDGGPPRVEVRSEMVARMADGSRHVMQGLPMLSAAVSDMASLPLTLPDGHQTTWGAVIAAMQSAARCAVDSVEACDHQGKTQCLRRHLAASAALETEK